MNIDLKDIGKFVINLDKRKDRLDQFDAEFRSFFGDGQSYVRISAVRGDPASKYIALSHKKAVAMAKELGMPAACIMEDDVVFTSARAFGYAQSRMSDAPKDWDVLLGGTYSAQVVDKYRSWQRLSDFSALHFYVIRSEAYDTVLSMESDMHIDRWMASSGLACYRTSKMFALQRPGYSDNAGRVVSYEGLVDNRNIV